MKYFTEAYLGPSRKKWTFSIIIKALLKNGSIESFKIIYIYIIYSGRTFKNIMDLCNLCSFCLNLSPFGLYIALNWMNKK